MSTWEKAQLQQHIKATQGGIKNVGRNVWNFVWTCFNVVGCIPTNIMPAKIATDLEVETDQKGRVFPFVELDGGVASWGGDEVELGQLHVRGDVDPSAAGPAVNNVLVRVAI